MYVRLAFAVAAHLQPEILLVDEVLAVGDVSFQSKCLGRMGDVAQSGRTILFVSHNMGAIGRLCHRSILLEAGRVVADGPTEHVIRRYITSVYPAEACRMIPKNCTRPVCIRRVRLLDDEGRPSTRLDRAHPFTVATEFEATRDVRDVHVGVALDRQDGTAVCHTLSLDATGTPLQLRAGERVTSRVTFPGGLFSAGDYVIHVGLADPVRAFDHREACAFQLIDSGSFASTDPSGRPRPGVVTLKLPWVLERTAPAQIGSFGADDDRTKIEPVLQGVASCPCS
jgi:lipopolysaccharide transport system ATP-binding protein